jgi:hypothetical protein
MVVVVYDIILGYVQIIITQSVEVLYSVTPRLVSAAIEIVVANYLSKQSMHPG